MRKRHRGISLIEVALVMLILGLLMSVGIGGYSAQRQVEALRNARLQLDEAREALIGYALVQGRLPRPAISALDGNERPGPCSNDADCTGYLPWVVLGLNKGDPWGKLLRYSVSPRYAGYTSGTDKIDLTTGGMETKTIRGVQAANPALLENLAPSIPAVVFSQGARNHGSDVAGNALADGSNNNPDEDSNHTASQLFISRTFSDGSHPRGEFDDLVIWISPYLLKSRLMQAGFVF